MCWLFLAQAWKTDHLLWAGRGDLVTRISLGGERRACLRPSINLITCKPALATGEEQRGDALNFIPSSREPLLLRIGSEDPVRTTVPPRRLVLVLRLKLKIKFGGYKTLWWRISGGGVMAQRTSFWFSALVFTVACNSSSRESVCSKQAHMHTCMKYKLKK